LGVEPESLKRIRSSDARDFIRQCLGRKDANGVLVRPSASELLGHSFLAKREDDDSQVEVDPPLRERPIQEGSVYVSGVAEPIRPMNSDSDRTAGYKQVSPVDIPVVASQLPPPLYLSNSGSPGADSNETGALPDIPHLQPQPQHLVTQAKPVQSCDFDGMPDSETNMKHVQVLMGRGHVVDEFNGYNHLPVPIQTEASPPASVVASPFPTPPSQLAPVGYQQAGPVSAFNDVVNDVVRVRKRSFVDSTAIMQQSGVGNDGGSLTINQGAPFDANLKYLQMAAIVVGNDSGVMFPNDIMQLRITLTVNGEEQKVQFGFHLIQDDAVQVAREMVNELNLPNDAILELSETISAMSRQARIRQGQYKHMIQQGLPIHSHPANNFQNMPNQFGVQNTAQTHPTHAANYDNSLEQSLERDCSVSSLQYEPQMASPVTDALHQSAITNALYPANVQYYPSTTSNAAATAGLGVAPVGTVQIRLPISDQYHPPASSSGVISTSHTSVPGPNNSSQSVLNTQSGSAAQPEATLPIHKPISAQYPPTAKSSSGVTSTSHASVPGPNNSSQSILNAIAGITTFDTTIEIEDEVEYEDEMGNSAELKQLEEEHEKKMKRAQKAFNTRMVSLQKSREEKEAQHLKTLEKHEKERIALEKRLKMAEEEQNQRLQKLEEEFIQQREIAKQSMKVAGQPLPTPLPPSDEEISTMAMESRISAMNLVSLADMNSNGDGNPFDVPVTIKSPSPTLSLDGSNDSVILPDR